VDAGALGLLSRVVDGCIGDKLDVSGAGAGVDNYFSMQLVRKAVNVQCVVAVLLSVIDVVCGYCHRCVVCGGCFTQSHRCVVCGVW
jgi:rRNA maturation endonuclease Nob1